MLQHWNNTGMPQAEPANGNRRKQVFKVRLLLRSRWQTCPHFGPEPLDERLVCRT